ncbi:hypothetical protein [Azomonas macrocytogenes]|uniref:DNA-binding transcriptional LysR family regulator n=1 Tax=Azomonas macrocytogenes TaxID=69962 RepID=A0A839T443_AZOMA|nr:hypothetical protein [Azomonas macrocytogenes]MBB3103256.1 DNA-binding transcriptional LysR family regulator [Azomonas macrocytogenes]
MREAIVAALRESARLGLSVALLAVPDALPWLESGELVRVLPRWWAFLGNLRENHRKRKRIAACRAAITGNSMGIERDQNLGCSFRAQLVLALSSLLVYQH